MPRPLIAQTKPFYTQVEILGQVSEKIGTIMNYLGFVQGTKNEIHLSPDNFPNPLGE